MSIKFFVFLSLLFLFIVKPGGAQAEGPDEVLRKIVAEMKTAGNPSPVVDYVEWEEAFEQMSPQSRTQMKISSADDLREYYRGTLKDPVKAMRSQLQEKMKVVSFENSSQIKQYLAREQEKMVREQQEVMARIRDTKYQVGPAIIEGDTANVKLTQIYKGKVSTEEVRFVKSGETWLLPSVSALSGANSDVPARAKGE